MRILLFTLMSVVCTAAWAVTVYKWVDENGVVHYSDQPHENAEKVHLKAPQTYTAPKSTAPSPSSVADSPTAPYQSCAISQPANDQMFMNTATVTAAVTLQPPVRPGDQLVVTLDGQRVPGVPASGGQFTISPVDRGTHSLQVLVQDAGGQTVCQAPGVTFHVHQPNLLSPQVPAQSGASRPRPRP
ncbi:MAG TPA: DUF4124 domain-containing protein [Steroidobacteraceae bacterium]